MALQAYADAQSGALQVYKAPELTLEEIERRQKEVRCLLDGRHGANHNHQAEELGEKLRIIDERVPHVPQNLQGTTAGAGSSTFHKYRLVRRQALLQALLQASHCSTGAETRARARREDGKGLGGEAKAGRV